ncbi:hypothetical protein BDR07DRAFT_1483621 [Suillus spraguei]|nr:hypothetical protein BDR07DRAFT_1483621 [Suillus spraguei]
MASPEKQVIHPEDSISMNQGARRTVFVVGLGMVGIAFIEKMLALDADKRYRLVTCGEVEWYAQQDPEHFLFHTGEQVTSLDTVARSVTTSKGRKISYDYCILATGSESTLPTYVSPVKAERARGIFVYRNISDLDTILSYSEQEHVKGGRAVVVGGGLIGLEAAKAVFDLETISEVVIINRQLFPLSRQLDDEGGEIVLRRIEAMGVRVLTRTFVKDVITLDGVLTGLSLSHDQYLKAEMVIHAIGITPRDDLARQAGLKCAEKGGIVINDLLQTSAQDVYAIGECASWKGNTYGLIAPGVEMADILSFNFTQVETDLGGFKPRVMNMPDLSTKLKLMGVDVASFGDYFADKRSARGVLISEVAVAEPLTRDKAEKAINAKEGEVAINTVTTGMKRESRKAAPDGPIECLTYRDPFSYIYKKYIFTADGKYLLGGMMVGDTSDYVKLVSLVKKKKVLEEPPSRFIIGSGSKGSDDSADLDDDTQICSCHNVTKGAIVESVKAGVTTFSDLKAKTKIGAGCGGCVPFATNIFKAEMKKAGHALSNHLCPHFAMGRQELFSVVKIRKLKTFPEIMKAVGVKQDSLGCEICKPAIGSILSSLYNELVMAPIHHANQDTNDKYLANIQRNGTFSVVPRIAGGEITPDKLIVLGQVANKYKLYSKITGAQRIDLFGAHKQDLPDIWEELVAAGFESGHAYGKALRTVKSCVGTTWCRYGIGDSVGMAIHLEGRYKGVRSPHKLKGGVSGCVRECAEAQSKDFGLIATERVGIVRALHYIINPRIKTTSVFVGGNGGSNPRHATLFATDVPPSKVIHILDRFIMYYIHTADKLMRTARWIEQFDGGIERLKKILLDDELGICADLEREMGELIGSYADEWKAVVNDPAKRRQFRQFVNTDERRSQTEVITERGQERPADWPKRVPPTKFGESVIVAPKSEWEWRKLATVHDLTPTDDATTSVAVKYGDSQLAIFHIPRRGYFATQQMCPHKRAFVLDHGIVGDDLDGNLYVSCKFHVLSDGKCLNDEDFSIIPFDVKQEDDDLLVLLPDSDSLDTAIGTSKWMVKQASAELSSRGGGEGIEIAGVGIGLSERGSACSGGQRSCSGGNASLDW